MADWILGPQDEIYTVLILHPRVFELSATELLTYRANTAFRTEDPTINFSIELSEEVSGLAYIVLHETTHIVDYVERHTPFVEPSMLELFGRSDRDSAFTDEVWSSYRELAPSISFGYQEDLRFYEFGGDPAFSNHEIPRILKALADTPFGSLYGSISWAEDFAEYVSFYYLVHSLGAQYTIRVERNDHLLYEYKPMQSPGVMDRVRFIDPALLRAPESKSDRN